MIADFRFAVTADIIAGARPGDMNRCAVADALVARGYKKPSVCVKRISFEREGERWTTCELLSPDLISFIIRFDAGYPVVPKSFVITARKNGGD